MRIKILNQRPLPYSEWEIPYAQVGLRKGRSTRNNIGSICCLLVQIKELQISLYLLNYFKPLTMSILKSYEFIWKYSVYDRIKLSWCITYELDKRALLGQNKEHNVFPLTKMSDKGVLYLLIYSIYMQKMSCGKWDYIETVGRYISNLRYVNYTLLLIEKYQLFEMPTEKR